MELVKLTKRVKKRWNKECIPDWPNYQGIKGFKHPIFNFKLPKELMVSFWESIIFIFFINPPLVALSLIGSFFSEQK